MTQTARVRVDEAAWRRVLGERSVAETLGALVELEVARTRAELTEREALEVLERIEAAQATLEALSRRLEWRLRGG